jgi:hypothetical protein
MNHRRTKNNAPAGLLETVPSVSTAPAPRKPAPNPEPAYGSTTIYVLRLTVTGISGDWFLSSGASIGNLMRTPSPFNAMPFVSIAAINNFLNDLPETNKHKMNEFAPSAVVVEVLVSKPVQTFHCVVLQESLDS